MFAVGAVVIMIVGVPDMAWYFVTALVCATLLAWGLVTWRRPSLR